MCILCYSFDYNHDIVENSNVLMKRIVMLKFTQSLRPSLSMYVYGVKMKTKNISNMHKSLSNFIDVT